MIKKKYRKYITNYETIDERIIKIYMNLYGRRLELFVIYALNDDDVGIEKGKFYNKLQEMMDNIEENNNGGR